jgi:hypothetical protein
MKCFFHRWKEKLVNFGFGYKTFVRCCKKCNKAEKWLKTPGYDGVWKEVDYEIYKREN